MTKKATSKVLAFVIALVMLIGMLPAVSVSAAVKVYFENSEGWADVYAYVWGGSGGEELGSWPGTKCDDEGDGIWSVSIPDDCTHVIFNNKGAGKQTNNLDNTGGNVIAKLSSGFETGEFGEIKTIYVWESYNPDDDPETTFPGGFIPEETGSDPIFGEETTVAEITEPESTVAETTVADTTTATEDEAEYYTVYFENSENWQSVFACTWDKDDNMDLGLWPGTECTYEGDGIWSVSIPASAVGIVFNDVLGEDQAFDMETPGKTMLAVMKGEGLVEGIEVYEWVEYTPPVKPTSTADETTDNSVPETTYKEAEGTVTVYACNDAGLSVVKAYYWNNNGDSIGWPGVDMTLVKDNIYKITFDAKYDFIIFNDGIDGYQSPDLTVEDGYIYYIESGSFGPYDEFEDDITSVVTDPVETDTTVADTTAADTTASDLTAPNTTVADETTATQPKPVKDYYVYFENSRNWNKVYIYAWAGSEKLFGSWPGQLCEQYNSEMWGKLIPANAEGIVFNNGSGIQGNDMNAPGKAMVAVFDSTYGEFTEIYKWEGIPFDVGDIVGTTAVDTLPVGTVATTAAADPVETTGSEDDPASTKPVETTAETITTDSIETTAVTEPVVTTTSTEPEETTAVTEPVSTTPDDSGTYRYYFYVPEYWGTNDFSSTVGIYWWEFTDACDNWPGYEAKKTDVEGVYYYDVPKDVEIIIWNNYINGGLDDTKDIYYSSYQTTNINTWYEPGDCEFYPEGLDSVENMIFVCDERILISEYLPDNRYSRNGEWYYYYGNGEYGTAKNKEDAEKVFTDSYLEEPGVEVAEHFELGDANRDGKVNIKDATAIQKHSAKLIRFEGKERILADFNSDGKINVKDATRIQKYVAKLI